MRSAGEHFDLQLSAEEVANQERWLSDPRVGASREEILQRRGMGTAKGIAIAAARCQQKVVDARFDGFHARAFTCFLTQSLWHEAESVQSVMARATQNLDTEQFNRVPIGCIAPLECDNTQSRSQSQPIYHMDTQDTDQAPAEAVIQSVEGNRATIWLGAAQLIAYQPIS